MADSSRIPMRTYLDEIKHAVEHIMPTLWHEKSELRALEKQANAAAARAAHEYGQANFIMLNAEDPDDFMMGVGAHWDSYWGPDKDAFYLSQDADQLRARITTRAFSTSALAGALLQYAKQGMSAVYSKPDNWPEGRKVGDVAVSVIIRHGRNQAMHWEEEKDPHPGLVKCFDKLAELDPVFGEYRERSLAMEVVELLGWKEYADFERDLLGAGEE
ncbi:hypothetical protein AB0N12_14405 [Streptomyces albogriseolus]|uniref:hypothetical protein n=1 Tax=Streptomyces albogriseolus TaxID=1887 RepID=UPI00345FC3F8